MIAEVDDTVFTPNSFKGNANQFRNTYMKDKESITIKERLKRRIQKTCSKESVIESVKRHCQLWSTLRTYKLRQDFPCDILAGISVGIMHIPQSMAYSMLATLPPISGLYTALFAPIVYLFLGTSKHLSMGVITVVSLMMAAVLDKRLDIENSLTSTVMKNDSSVDSLKAIENQKIDIAVALTFVSGAVMFVLGKIGLGVIANYMSDPLISAFTSGVAVQVFVSQLKNILGLKIRRYNGVFKIFKTLIEVFKNIGATNLADLTTSAICMLMLYLVKAQINERFKKYLPIPIPIELFVIILSTVLSYFLKFESTFGVDVVGDIPAGLPYPRLPNFGLIPDVFPDAVLIGIVAFGQSISISKILARRHNYKIQPNQEMVAYGVGSVVCSLFTGYVNAGSVARSLVQDSAGGRTQIASIFSCLVVLVVILAVGPFFYALPQAVLSSVILIALRSMFLQIRVTKTLWRTSKYDLFVWIVTYASVLILDADIGLALGMAVSILTVVIRTQRARPVLLGRIGDTNNFKPTKLYNQVEDIPGVKILSYNSPLYFANVDSFLSNVSKCLGIDIEKRQKPSWIGVQETASTIHQNYSQNDNVYENRAFMDNDKLAALFPEIVPSESEVAENSGIAGLFQISQRSFGELGRSFSLKGQHYGTIDLSTNNAANFVTLPSYSTLQPSPSVSSFSSSVSQITNTPTAVNKLIFDMGKVLFVDSVGVRIIEQLIADSGANGIEVLLAECNDDVIDVLRTCDTWADISLRLYLTVQDAVDDVTGTSSTVNGSLDQIPRYDDAHVNTAFRGTYL